MSDICYICSGDLSEGLNQEEIESINRFGFKMEGHSELIKGGLFSSPEKIEVCYFCMDGIKLIGSGEENCIIDGNQSGTVLFFNGTVLFF